MAEKYLKLIFSRAQADKTDVGIAKIKVYNEIHKSHDFEESEWKMAEEAIMHKYQKLCTAWANDKFAGLDVRTL